MNIAAAVAHYLTQLRAGDAEHAFFGLLELGPDALPLLIVEADKPENRLNRAALVEVIWQHRRPETIPLLGRLLDDPDPEVWQHALDGLVATGGPAAEQEVRDALARAVTRKNTEGAPSEWLLEVLRQMGEPPWTPLFRPVGPKELTLIEASGWTTFPPRLPEQPIFYPVLNEEYAAQIARDWNVPDYGAGYVLRFAVETAFVERYPVRRVGSAIALELWVPAEELDEFNRHIVGTIELIDEFHA